MPRVDWLKAGAALTIGLVVGGAVWWVTEPSRVRKANNAAATTVQAKATTSVQTGAEQTRKLDDKASAGEAKRTARRDRVVPRIVASPDPYPEFLNGMCNTELYQSDPICIQRNRGKRKDRASLDREEGV